MLRAYAEPFAPAFSILKVRMDLPVVSIPPTLLPTPEINILPEPAEIAVFFKLAPFCAESEAPDASLIRGVELPLTKAPERFRLP